jgi:hypothetical protein
MNDDAALITIIEGLQVQFLTIAALKASPTSALDKRCLAIANTELETAMLWLANARTDSS